MPSPSLPLPLQKFAALQRTGRPRPSFAARTLTHLGSKIQCVGVCCRREVVPLVCKQWRAASGPQSPIWESCEVSYPSRVFVPDLALPILRWSAVVQCASPVPCVLSDEVVRSMPATVNTLLLCCNCTDRWIPVRRHESRHCAVCTGMIGFQATLAGGLQRVLGRSKT